MDFSLTSDQMLIKQSARRFLEDKCPKARVRELREDERGYDPEMWREMVDLGWMGLLLPEEYGGMGQNISDLAVVMEEIGRSLLPSPLFPTVALCSLPLLAHGTSRQKEAFLPGIASGEAIWSLALTESTGKLDASEIRLQATLEGEDYVLEGTKLFVPYGHVADYFLAVARTSDGKDSGEGLTCFIVEARCPGIEIRIIPTPACDKQCEVRFNRIRIPQNSILGEKELGWDVVETILQKATILKCAEMLGAAQAVLEMTTEYAKNRIQFDKPIGSFQAVQHNLVSLMTEIEGLRYLVYQAAWQESEGKPSALLVSMTKKRANAVYQRTCIDGIKLHGAIGFTEELDLGLYHLNTRASLFTLGDSDFHRERIAQELARIEPPVLQ